jgi:hypothetical protein
MRSLQEVEMATDKRIQVASAWQTLRLSVTDFRVPKSRGLRKGDVKPLV